MVTQHVARSFGFLKTTAIGGLFFLLPLVVVGVLVGQLIQILYAIATQIGTYLPAQTPAGYALLFLSAVALVVLGCFLAGVVARRSLARQFTHTTEKYLLMMFPRYAIFKEQLSGNIGGEIFKNRLSPVMVSFNEFQRLGFEVERASGGRVTVYLPGSPDPWSGTVVLVDAARVEPLAVDFGAATGACENLGQDMQQVLARVHPAPLGRRENGLGDQ